MIDQATKTGLYIVALIRGILNDEMLPEKPDDVSFKDVFKMSKEHMISVMTYTAIEKLQTKPEEDLIKKWNQSAYTNIAQSVIQLSERDNIYKVLEQNRIPYIPLKGCLVKEMYPKPEYREMSDLDILVKRADAAKLKPVMESLGYKCKSFDIEKDDSYSKKPFMHVEMHYELLSQDEVHFYKESGAYRVAVMDPWSNAVKKNDYHYEMRKEDLYLHLVTHLYKHFKGAGTGIRQVTDLFVVKNKCSLDWEYINQELNRLGLLEFHENIMSVIAVWYEGMDLTEETDATADYIFSAGSYGHHSTFVEHRVGKMKTENSFGSAPVLKYLLFRLFPPYEEMCRWYPLTRKSKLLLPIMWVYRLFYKGRTQFGRAIIELKTLKKISSDQKNEKK